MNEKELFKILLEGKSNTLGRVLEIYDKILSSQLTVMDVYNLYKMENRIVSMRVSNILKRLWRTESSYILPIVDQFIKDAREYKNPTFRWTIAQMFKELFPVLNIDQRIQLLFEIQRNFQLSDDWIMLSQSIDALIFAKNKKFEIIYMTTILDNLARDERKIIKEKLKKLKLLK
jgi:hypothetical protein